MIGTHKLTISHFFSSKYPSFISEVSVKCHKQLTFSISNYYTFTSSAIIIPNKKLYSHNKWPFYRHLSGWKIKNTLIHLFPLTQVPPTLPPVDVYQPKHFTPFENTSPLVTTRVWRRRSPWKQSKSSIQKPSREPAYFDSKYWYSQTPRHRNGVQTFRRGYWSPTGDENECRHRHPTKRYFLPKFSNISIAQLLRLPQQIQLNIPVIAITISLHF